MKQESLSLSWIAGFFDGEGTVFHYSFMNHGKRYQQVRAAIGQKEFSILNTIKDYFKCGSIHEDMKSGPGFYVWTVSCKQALYVLTKLFPYLKTKHKRQQTKRGLQILQKQYKGNEK